MFFLSIIHISQACPAVFCGSNSNGSSVTYTPSTNQYHIQACNLTNYTSPHPSHFSLTYSLQCEYWIDAKYWNSTSWQDYYSYAITSEGSSCDPYGIVSVCDSSKNLVCFCASAGCSCVKGLVYGQACEIKGLACIPGYVCSNKICTKMYSLKAGDRSTNSLSCQGGGPLVIQVDHFVCRKPPMTLGGIPKQCVSDNDCISDTGSDISKCTCGLNTDGKAFCGLHFGDQPMVNWREAARDGNYKSEIYWQFVSVNYPYLQGNIDSCMGEVWRDYYQYMIGNGVNTTSSSLVLKLAISYLIIWL